MGNLKTRIDKADAELKDRLRAEWEAAARPVIDLTLQAPDVEQEAFCRAWRSDREGDFTAEEWLELCGGVLDPQPGDAELLAALDARIPPDRIERLQKAAEAARAAGVEG